MTADHELGPDEAPRRSGHVTTIYVTAVAVVGLGLTAATAVADDSWKSPILVILALFAILNFWSGSIVLDNKVSLNFASIIILAAMALVGPAGAGIVGIILGPLERGPVPLKARIFNGGLSATLGVLGGWAFLLSGGSEDASLLTGAFDIVRHLGVPILVAGFVQLTVNFLLLGGVLWASLGVPLGSQVASLFRSLGPVYLGYGVIAFLMVVLWEPAKLGASSVALVLAPLLVARWAYVQYGEEVNGHARALQVLVAAVEAKAPHLMGHSARVAELCSRTAEVLGLRPQLVADVRVAGMLHDIGLTTLPTATVRGPELAENSSALHQHPARGADLLVGLTFLSGSLEAIAHHRDALDGWDPRDDESAQVARLVGLADEFDLLTEVGTPGGMVLSADEALGLLAQQVPGSEPILHALEQAATRSPSGAAA